MEYDPEANALYVKFSDKKVSRTEELKPGIILDFDRKCQNSTVGSGLEVAGRRLR